MRHRLKALVTKRFKGLIYFIFHYKMKIWLRNAANTSLIEKYINTYLKLYHTNVSSRITASQKKIKVNNKELFVEDHVA